MTSVQERKNSEGMLDIGQHCVVCRQLDFLPFVCPKCNKAFCNNHRTEFNQHQCVLDEQKSKLDSLEKSKIDVSKLPKASEAFPDLDKIRKDAEIKHKQEQNKKIGQRLTNVKGSNNTPLTSIEVAMLRLKKLLGSNYKKNISKNNTKKSLFSGFKSSSTSSSTAAKMVEMNKLKRSAKGDNRISVNDRVYVWIINTSDDDTKFEIKSAQFFSKRWPIGKMLDSSAELSKIKNYNNKVVDKSLKLAMFRRVRDGESVKSNNANNLDGDFVYIPTSGRVEKEIKDGDEIYILRGQR